MLPERGGTKAREEWRRGDEEEKEGRKREGTREASRIRKDTGAACKESANPFDARHWSSRSKSRAAQMVLRL